MPLDPARAEATRRALLDAASTLIADQGIGRTSHDDIGKLAGLSRGAITSQFGGREDFLQYLSDHALEVFKERFPSPRRMASASLDTILDTYCQPLISDPHACRLLLVLGFEASGPHRSLAPKMQTAHAALQAACTTLVSNLQAGGEISRDADPARTAQFAVAGFLGIMLHSSFDPSSSLDEQYAEFQRTLKAHLTPRPTRAHQ